MKRATCGVFAVALAALVAAASISLAGQARKKRRPNPAMAPIEDQEGLPRALLIGDSISIGYTLPTRKLLEGKVNLHRARTNCGPTTRCLQQIDRWLGETKWDVIHFNWGLHDLAYRNPKSKNFGHLDKVDGELTTSLADMPKKSTPPISDGV